ncbi:metallophosphoesterase [Maritalea mobilis]|uniref:metallophosphoesterase n=1 Tax=Maritalea mobilis TaxID=483324 RepID=UPI001C98A1F4|nr:metallophosphoesterase [Maritalea mobilis]MBY6202835.1 metallophosphoesterase [Maritalea mobilis]
MPRLLTLADLHLDKWAAKQRDPLALMPKGWFEQFDMVIIAGDLVDKPKARLASALAQIGQYVPLDRVQIFPGNHCFYHHVLDDEVRLAQIVINAGAGYAQCKPLALGDVRILPCTLWTDLTHPTIHPDIIAGDLQRGMNDYRYIRIAKAGYRKAKAFDMRAVHQRHLAWLRTQLEMPHDGPSIVVTHHAPLLDQLGAEGTLAHAYGSDLLGFITEMRPSAWLYGHTHQAHEVWIGKTNIKNVSLGYPFDLSNAEARERIEAAAMDVPGSA